jgi:predicted nucleic acid-binding protein
MAVLLLLDSNILSKLVRPDLDDSQQMIAGVGRLLEDSHFDVCVPEIVDYEIRRKLLHLAHRRHQGRKWAQEALTHLDKLVAIGYIPLTTEMMRLAAALWAQTRAGGQLRSSEESLDVDVILAAQARQSGGQIVTTNDRHFRNIADVFDWHFYSNIT